MLELRKDIFADERDDNLKEIGKGTQRQDMLGHVTGTSTYFDDHKLQGMLHLKIVRSTHLHARLRRIDTTDAERSPGVRRIIRGADVPRNLNTLLSLINFGIDDEPSLAVDKVRYRGEPIVAVAIPVPGLVETESTVATVVLSEAKVIVTPVIARPYWSKACAVN